MLARVRRLTWSGRMAFALSLALALTAFAPWWVKPPSAHSRAAWDGIAPGFVFVMGVSAALLLAFAAREAIGAVFAALLVAWGGATANTVVEHAADPRLGVELAPAAGLAVALSGFAMLACIAAIVHDERRFRRARAASAPRA